MNLFQQNGLIGVEVAYRYVDQLVSAGIDEFGTPLGPSHIQIYCYEYEVLSHTPKGFWISYGDSEKRFILKDAKKCFAHLTKEAALQSFVKRKQRQISILSHQICNAEAAITLAKRQMDKIV